METKEKENMLAKLREEQLRLAAVMTESDAHACKCVKLGLNFSHAYPDEFAAYVSAREKYNDNEKNISLLEKEIEESITINDIEL